MLATSVAIGSIYHVAFHDRVTVALTAPKVLPPDEAAEENNIYEQVVEDEESGGGYEIPAGAGNGSTGAMAETEFKKESPSNNNNNTTKEAAAIDRLESDEKKSDGMTKLVIEEKKQLTGEPSKRLGKIRPVWCIGYPKPFCSSLKVQFIVIKNMMNGSGDWVCHVIGPQDCTAHLSEEFLSIHLTQFFAMGINCS